MNEYSQEWFDTFLAPLSIKQTAREIDLLARNLLRASSLQPSYANILDVCCGMGRHARLLSERGYRVTGVDANERALAHAQRVDVRTRYVLGDLRALDALGETFDAVLILWQSFGNCDDATNEKIVCDIARLLTPRGRFILDIYNRAFFETRLGERKIEMDGREIIESKSMNGNRLRVELEYGESTDVYEWQIFYPDEISALASRCGFMEILRCTNFDSLQYPVSTLPRMQFVFEKRA